MTDCTACWGGGGEAAEEQSCCTLGWKLKPPRRREGRLEGVPALVPALPDPRWDPSWALALTSPIDTRKRQTEWCLPSRLCQTPFLERNVSDSLPNQRLHQCWVLPFTPQLEPVRWALLSLDFRKSGSERVRASPKVTQQARVRARTLSSVWI